MWNHQSENKRDNPYNVTIAIAAETCTWAVRLRKSNHGDEPPQLPPEVRCAAHDELPTLELHPLRDDTLPLAFNPGGGPRDFGAHSSDVTAVEGFKSPKVPFDVGSLFWGLQQK